MSHPCIFEVVGVYCFSLKFVIIFLILLSSVVSKYRLIHFSIVLMAKVYKFLDFLSHPSPLYLLCDRIASL